MQWLDFRKMSKLQEQRRTIRTDKLQAQNSDVSSFCWFGYFQRIIYESDWIGSRGSHKSDSLNRKPPPSHSLPNNKEFLHIIFNTYKNLFSQEIYIHFSTVKTIYTMQDVTDIVWRIARGRKGITESILWTGSLKWTV